MSNVISYLHIAKLYIIYVIGHSFAYPLLCLVINKKCTPYPPRMGTPYHYASSPLQFLPYKGAVLFKKGGGVSKPPKGCVKGIWGILGDILGLFSLILPSKEVLCA
jgi:hypothetical protein